MIGPNQSIVSQKMFGLHGQINPGHEPTLDTNGGLLYYQYDGLHTVSELTNRHGDIIESYRYDAFGGIITGITAPYNRVGYTSQEYDDVTGLIDMNARWYHPTISRFMSEDTWAGSLSSPQTLNRYSYVLNNPINMWDPTGNVPEWIGQNHRETIWYNDIEVEVIDWTLQNYNYFSTGETMLSSQDTGREIIETWSETILEEWTYHYRSVYYIIHHIDDWDRSSEIVTESIDTFTSVTDSMWQIIITGADLAASNKQLIQGYGNLPIEKRVLSTTTQSSFTSTLLDISYYSNNIKLNIYNETLGNFLSPSKNNTVSIANMHTPSFEADGGGRLSGLTEKELRNKLELLIEHHLKTEWIPEVMQLNGSSDSEQYLTSRVKNLNSKINNKDLKWNQEKINQIWDASQIIYDEYSIQVDPRLLLAIIFQEGTGSFNTSATNLAADGQHGVETNFAKDLMKANNLIFGKILGYAYYGDDFNESVANNNNKVGISGDGNFFQYTNWNTPIIDIDKGRVRYGVYAGHGAWHEGVGGIYEMLSYDGASSQYSAYLSGVSKETILNITNGISLPNVVFKPSQTSQDYRGKPNGEYIIQGKATR